MVRRPTVAVSVFVANLAIVGAVLTGWAPATLGLIVIVPLLAALRRRPQLGVLVLVALVPYDGLLIILPLPQIARSWKEALVLATLLATFVAPREQRAGSGRRLPGWALALAALVGLAAVSALLVGGQQALTGFRIDFFYLLLAWAVWRCPLDGRQRDRLVTIFMVNGVVTSVYGIAQQAIGDARLNALGYPYNSTIRYTHGFLRSFSTFSYQSPFAYFLMVVVLLGAAQVLQEPRRLRNRAFVVSLPVMLLGLFFTFERGAWLGLAVGGLYLALTRRRALLLAVPVALVALAYLPGNITTSAFQAQSLVARTSGWQQNLQHVLDHPLGIGIGATGAAAEKTASLEAGAAPASVIQASIATTYEPDNYYYKTVYELGVVGLWFLVLLLVGATSAAHRAQERLRGRDSALSAAVAAFVLAAVVASTVSSFFEIFPMDMITCLLLAVVATSETCLPAVPSLLEPFPGPALLSAP